jgi:hypothetical protein
MARLDAADPAVARVAIDLLLVRHPRFRHEIEWRDKFIEGMKREYSRLFAARRQRKRGAGKHTDRNRAKILAAMQPILAEHPEWRATRIAKRLADQGIEVSVRTVFRLLNEPSQ